MLVETLNSAKESSSHAMPENRCASMAHNGQAQEVCRDMAALPRVQRTAWSDAKSGDTLLTASNRQSNRHRFRGRTGADSPLAQRESRGGVSSTIVGAGCEVCFFWQGCRTKRKSPPA